MLMQNPLSPRLPATEKQTCRISAKLTKIFQIKHSNNEKLTHNADIDG